MFKINQKKSREENLTAVDNLKINKVLSFLVVRLYGQTAKYKFEGKENYKNLTMPNKPALSILEAEFDLYKVEHKAAINAFFDILAEKEALNIRITSLKHPQLAASRASGEPNGAKILKELLENRDSGLMELIEAEDLLAEEEINKDKDNKKKKKNAFNALSDDLATLKGTPTNDDIKNAVVNILKYIKFRD